MLHHSTFLLGVYMGLVLGFRTASYLANILNDQYWHGRSKHGSFLSSCLVILIIGHGYPFKNILAAHD
jgi:predicted membrane chloride channel (bestrophin family)